MASIKQFWVLTARIVKQNLTNADTIITVIAMPVFMLLFFVYVLGGNVVTTGAASAHAYLRYALPGFLLLTMAMGSAYTAMRINRDQTTGMLDRLHSLPIPRGIILGAHVTASVLFMVLAEAAVFAVGVVMGYRVHNSAGVVLGFIGLSLLFAVTVTLLAIPFSLRAKDAVSAGGFSYLLLMLLFVSSALMPTAGMAGPIRAFANHQPMTPVVNAARGLLDSGNSLSALPIAFIWLAGGAVLFAGLAYWAYRRVFLQR